MPHKVWKHTCTCHRGEVRLGVPTCPDCGQAGVYDGWGTTATEGMGNYIRVYGLKAIGPHRKLADRLFREATRVCKTCKGRRLCDIDEGQSYQDCPDCSGLGRIFKRSGEDMSVIRQRVLEAFPDAAAAWVRRSAERVEFIYYAAHEGFEIVTRTALDKMVAAKRCKTWGEYADLCGVSWEEMLEGYQGEIEELTGQEGPSRDAPFDFGAIRGLYYSGDLITDPRTDAYDTLSKEVLRDKKLKGKIECSHGSPAGHLECVTATSEDAIRLLESIIHEEGYTGYLFTRDDSVFKVIWE